MFSSTNLSLDHQQTVVLVTHVSALLQCHVHVEPPHNVKKPNSLILKLGSCKLHIHEKNDDIINILFLGRHCHVYIL